MFHGEKALRFVLFAAEPGFLPLLNHFQAGIFIDPVGVEFLHLTLSWSWNHPSLGPGQLYPENLSSNLQSRTA
jgi:hypothetical protein